ACSVRMRRRGLAARGVRGAPGRLPAEALRGRRGQLLAERSAAPAAVLPPAEKVAPQGAVWVTRRGIHVDRMASAWLIRRFIDPAAHFRFVDPRSYRQEVGELRFDMFEAEFTHEGDLCTFAVLLSRFGLSAPALRAIAEMVHDVDLKDA